MAGSRLTQVSDHIANGDAPNGAGAYTIREEPLGTARRLRIVGIGAGASGINLIRTLRLNLTNYEHVVYEKNDDVGGTWLENRYPGCRNDVPSHNYQLSWRPNPEWSGFFAPAEEIRAYLRRICEDEGMLDCIKLSHRVVGALWNEAKAVWELKVEDLSTGRQFDDYANFLADAGGIMNKWKWPDIEGLHDFKGDLIHSANWPKGYDYASKTVAVIGNGASGIQIVPAIQPTVQKLYHVVRTPTWIPPPRLQAMKMLGQGAEALKEIELDEHENFTPAQIERFKTDPAYYRKFIKAIEKATNGNFQIMQKDSPTQAFARAQTEQYMKAMLGGDERLCRALIPDFPVGCRRITPAPGYLESLRQPNVELVTDGIRRVVPEGLVLASGEVAKVDALICATGFDMSFRPRYPLVGRDGNLQDIWSDQVPKAYMSCAVPGVPNYFTFLGPNAPIGHGSVFTLTEQIARYIARAIRKCQTEGIRALAPTRAAVDDYHEHISALMPRTTWASSCRSWFKGGGADGPVTALHPGSRVHFFHMLERFRGEDYEYVYDGAGRNRFWYLGNGFSSREVEEGADETWYLDGDDVLP